LKAVAKLENVSDFSFEDDSDDNNRGRELPVAEVMDETPLAL